MTFRRHNASATVDWAEPFNEFRYQPPPFGQTPHGYGPGYAQAPNVQQDFQMGYDYGMQYGQQYGVDAYQNQPYQDYDQQSYQNHHQQGWGYAPDAHGMFSDFGAENYQQQNFAANAQYQNYENDYQPAAHGYQENPDFYDPEPTSEMPSFLRGEEKKPKSKFKIDFNLGERAQKAAVPHKQDFLTTFKKEWIQREFDFSMNKISMSGLIFGLMFLGSVFFLIGFLVAVNLYSPKGTPDEIIRGGYTPSDMNYLAARTGTMPMNAMGVSAGVPGFASTTNIHGLPMMNQATGRMPSNMRNQAQVVPNQIQRRAEHYQRMPSQMAQRGQHAVQQMAYGAMPAANRGYQRTLH